MFNACFYELFSLLEKQNGSRLHIRCRAFNTWANRVAIVCSVITKIFNPVQVLDGDISTFLNNTCVNSVLVNNCSLPVLYCLTFVQCFCSVIHCSILLFSIHTIFSKYSVLILECVPGIFIPKNNNYLASQ